MCKMTTMGIEPTIFRFEVGRLIHWATRPMVHSKHLAIKYSNLEKYYITMAPEVLGTLYVNSLLKSGLPACVRVIIQFLVSYKV